MVPARAPSLSVAAISAWRAGSCTAIRDSRGGMAAVSCLDGSASDEISVIQKEKLGIDKGETTTYMEIPAEGGEKVLREFVVSQGSLAAGKKVRELEWPRESLLVAVKRGDNELIPKGSTRLLPGDSLVVMADEYDSPDIMGQMERICGEQI